MASRDDNIFRKGEASLVDTLALSVISQISDGSNKHRSRRLEMGTRMLLSAALEDKVFDQEQTKSDLQAFRISPTDIIDHCIPQAALELGEAWLSDTLSFARVSAASARLYGLCKAVGQEWDGVHTDLNSRTILVATIGREDHIIGPAVLAEQLRRRGHSVKLMQNSNGPDIAMTLREGRHDGILISASSLTTLVSAQEAIKILKNCYDGPVILGGAILGLGKQLTNTGADLVTNDIDTALDAMTRGDMALRVAE